MEGVTRPRDKSPLHWTPIADGIAELFRNIHRDPKGMARRKGEG